VLGRQPKLIATMKKLFLIMAAMFAVVSFSACSDDDDKMNPNNIIGTWQIIESQETDGESDEVWPTETDYYTYTFNDNGTAILKWHDGSNEEYNYTYSINGNVLTMQEKNTTEPMTYIFQIKELTKSRLVLFEHEVNPDDENDVYEATLTFKKI
jgi:outer membrane protein assembly factor BamE (lipoprotein component of BamABCDE complex)